MHGRYEPPELDLGTFRVVFGHDVLELHAIPPRATRGELATLHADPGLVVTVRGRHRAEVVEDVSPADLLDVDLVDDVRAAVLAAVERAAWDEYCDHTPDVAFVYADRDNALEPLSRLIRAWSRAVNSR
jgi:hypothetical protein